MQWYLRLRARHCFLLAAGEETRWDEMGERGMQHRQNKDAIKSRGGRQEEIVTDNYRKGEGSIERRGGFELELHVGSYTRYAIEASSRGMQACMRHTMVKHHLPR